MARLITSDMQLNFNVKGFGFGSLPTNIRNANYDLGSYETLIGLSLHNSITYEYRDYISIEYPKHDIMIQGSFDIKNNNISGTVQGFEFYRYGSGNSVIVDEISITSKTWDPHTSSYETYFSKNDFMMLSQYSDFVDGYAGNDRIAGNGGNDKLFGGSGNDKIYGGRGNWDYDLYYWFYDDYGDGGNDTINGGLGNDTLTGGTGVDTFIFSTALGTTNLDRITDFSVTDDTIWLENTGIFKALTTLGTLSSSSFHTGTAAGDAADRIIYNSTTGSLSYDVDGSGKKAAIQFATLTTGLALTNADFWVI